jgi:hypothetical protein
MVNQGKGSSDRVNSRYEWDAGVKDGTPLNAVRKQLGYDEGDEERNVYRRLPDGSLKLLSAEELKREWSEDLQEYCYRLEDGTIKHNLQEYYHTLDDSIIEDAFGRESGWPKAA